MSNNKFLTIISTLFIIICFSINTYAITEKQYLIINDLIEQENIDKAYKDLKKYQSNFFSNEIELKKILTSKVKNKFNFFFYLNDTLTKWKNII